MANSTSSANDVFRFVSIRGTSEVSTDALDRRYIVWNLSANDPALLQAEQTANANNTTLNPLLSIELPKLSGQQDAEALMARAVTLFQSQSRLRMTPADLLMNYPTKLSDVYLWLRDNNRDRSVTVANLTTEIQNALGGGTTIAGFVTSPTYFLEKLRLWENLVAEFINPTEVSFLERLQEMIKWFWMMERINATAIKNGQDIFEATYATVVLPRSTYYYKPKVTAENEPPQPPEKDKEKEKQREKDSKRLKDLETAASEIKKEKENHSINKGYEQKYCGEKQTKENREQPPPPSLMNRRSVEALSQATHYILDDLQIPKTYGLDADHALARIENEKNSLLDKYQVDTHVSVVVNINGKLLQLDNLCHHYDVHDPCAPYKGPSLPKGRGLIRTPGVADLKVIKSTLLKYATGEIAHIENVLKGEVKIREFNTLKRNEEVFMTDQETTTETEKESQSTDRYEVERELSEMAKEDMKFDTGVKISASLGPVNIDSHVDFAYAKSKEESTKTATKASQEMINRALSRVVERSRKQKTTTTIVQTDDKNRHKLENNKANAANIRGVYYWLDKYYLAKVVNYGKRLMFEFIVPEPAAFYIYSQTNKPATNNAKVKPEPPYILKPMMGTPLGGGGTLQFVKVPITSFKDITADNYKSLTALYEAQDIHPPYADTVVVSESLQGKGTGTEVEGRDRNGGGEKYKQASVANKTMAIPDGYVAETGYVTLAGWGLNTNASGIAVLLGNVKREGADWSYTQQFTMNNEDKIVPFAAWGYNIEEFVMNAEIVCRLTPRHMEEWKLTTYNAVMAAYKQKLVEYENWVKEQEVSQGIVIQGHNPDSNRAIEKEELKKHCIEMMSGQRFETFDAMQNNVPDLNYPEFSINEASAEGDYIQFFEQAFEWEQITYLFFPYFWGRKSRWVQIKSLSDPDPIFTNFLQAGAARVLVPARPGFERTVIHYFVSNGKIWNGGNPPVPGDDLWVSIVDEIKEQQGQFTGGMQEGEPWIYKVPTSLIYLDDLKPNPLPDYSQTDYPNDVLAAKNAKTAADFS